MADNSSKKFKFISPGVFIDEIDQSQLPAVPTEVGPVVIGRARKGPADKPVQVESFSDFVQTFGNPVAGNEGGDTWREGNNTAPTYAAYAAKAWLRNNSPLTFLRVLGDEKSGVADAGKAGWEVNDADVNNDGGVFALVVWPSASVDSGTTVVSGAVAAQFYTNGRVLLSASVGTGKNGSTLYEVSTKDDFKLVFVSGSTDEEVKVSLDPSSPNFIRKALNTNPTITNSAITAASTRTYYQGGFYWLGESFEYSAQKPGTNGIGLLAGGDDTKYHAAILPMAVNGASTTIQQNNWRAAATKATTGWFISQDLSTNTGAYAARNQQKLFRLEALSAGEWAQREVKISISNIKAPTGDFQSYGSFSVLIRDINDTDNRQVILERFDELNLNPASENYIAKRIGDRYQVYSATDQRNVEYGEFENQSNYVRVVMNDDVAAGSGETRWLPFGVFGPMKYRDVSVVSGSSGFAVPSTPASASRGDYRTMLDGDGTSAYGTAGHLEDNDDIISLNILSGTRFSGSIQFPSVPLRLNSTDGSPRNTKNTFWGAWTGRSRSDTFYNPEITDMLRARTFDLSSFNENPANTDLDVEGETFAQTGSAVNISWVFSLDNISGSTAAGYAYSNGYRAAGTSVSAVGNYTSSLDAGLDRFTTVLHGGFDGLDIKEREPFRNTKMDDKTEDTSYEIYSLRKAINIVSSPDDVSMNAIVMPGITNETVTNDLLDTAEERGDALAIIDIENAYTPDTEALGSSEDRNSGNTPSAAASALANRSINNSYGATYYPWVSILDTETNQRLWSPPSVAALGVLSNTDRLQAPWFAPAGFTRGGLSEGAAGVPVLDVSRKLTSDDRDTLYETNINPIAKFPAEGIVIFGQKTLQQTASALDRINVRRLMIYLKREISFIASRLLFAPNAQATWDRFLGQAEPVLRDVKAQFG
ncbi:MAG: phage tail sheath subtilisin-like domain-containing protein, partial [Planctomycetota bacterium]